MTRTYIHIEEKRRYFSFKKIVFDNVLGFMYKDSHASNDKACSCFKS